MSDSIPESLLNRPVASKYRNTLAILVIGMAGSGKTCYVNMLISQLKSMNKRVYSINLDPAVIKTYYKPNIDIRDSIKYRDVMKKYNLGPNGAIMTSLNLFVTRFDKVLELLDRRADSLDYIVIDTPGQVEVFNWSASGTVILESLSSSFPTMVNYLIDTTRSQQPITFMTNMIYACRYVHNRENLTLKMKYIPQLLFSVMYKCQLPIIACFNKIDVNRHEICLEWMQDYDQFYESITQDDSYMASFSRSCALMLNEFYYNLTCSGVSSITGEGFDEHIKQLNDCINQYKSTYLPWLERRRMESISVNRGESD